MQRCYIFLVCGCLAIFSGCAKIYYITAHDGRKIEYLAGWPGDQEYYYSYEQYENGQFKAERYGFKRKISPVLEAGASMAESALAGAKSAL